MSNIIGCSQTAQIKPVKYVEVDLSCDKYSTIRFDDNDNKSFTDLSSLPELKNIKLTVDKLVRYTHGNANSFSSCTKLYD